MNNLNPTLIDTVNRLSGSSDEDDVFALALIEKARNLSPKALADFTRAWQMMECVGTDGLSLGSVNLPDYPTLKAEASQAGFEVRTVVGPRRTTIRLF